MAEISLIFNEKNTSAAVRSQEIIFIYSPALPSLAHPTPHITSNSNAQS
ncbi:hypothetical protein [Microcystis aeruginosa]|jgi:hypothetical protein|nr:hypothetical protein [Microcystis aeruginosa]